MAASTRLASNWRRVQEAPDEEARFCAELVNPTPIQRWLLVTSALQMPRALARAAGFNVEPWPVYDDALPETVKLGQAVTSGLGYSCTAPRSHRLPVPGRPGRRSHAGQLPKTRSPRHARG